MILLYKEREVNGIPVSEILLEKEEGLFSTFTKADIRQLKSGQNVRVSWAGKMSGPLTVTSPYYIDEDLNPTILLEERAPQTYLI